MRAIRQHTFGSPEALVYEDVADPHPGEGQVRIAVEVAGVHVIDTAIRAGAENLLFPLPRLPMTPGREVAGVVESVGPGVATRWIGRRATAHLGLASGGYAELALAPGEGLHELPDGLEAGVAVAMIGTGRTAVGILDQAALSAADVVLVTAAAGGLGSLFVQGARAAGAVVAGVAGGPQKVELVRSLGADIAVDYLEPGWPGRVAAALGERRVSVVLDGVGGAQGRAAMDLLRPGGRMLLFGYSSGEATPLATSDIIRLRISVSWALGGIVGRMRELETRSLAEAAAGRLIPVVASESRSPRRRTPTARSRGAPRSARPSSCRSHSAWRRPSGHRPFRSDRARSERAKRPWQVSADWRILGLPIGHRTARATPAVAQVQEELRPGGAVVGPAIAPEQTGPAPATLRWLPKALRWRSSRCVPTVYAANFSEPGSMAFGWIRWARCPGVAAALSRPSSTRTPAGPGKAGSPRARREDSNL